MKTTTFLSGMAAAFILSLNAHAQNYTIKMTMHMDGLPPEMSAMGDMDMVTYIKGDKMKSERTGMMGTSTTLIVGDKLTSLSENMGNKFGYTATKEEIEAVDKTEKSEKPKIEYVNEKKTFAGYECLKAIATTIGKDKKENKIILWYTDKISFANRGMSRSQGRGMMDLSELKGYPLGMEMSDSRQGNEVKITLSTTEVKTSALDDSVFNVSTDGYKMTTYKEMLDRQKAMQGMGR